MEVTKYISQQSPLCKKFTPHSYTVVTKRNVDLSQSQARDPLSTQNKPHWFIRHGTMIL